MSNLRDPRQEASHTIKGRSIAQGEENLAKGYTELF